MRTINCTVAGDISFLEEQASGRLIETLRNELSLKNPVFEKSQIMGFKPVPGTPETFEGLLEDEDEIGDKIIRIPRGAVKIFKARARELGFDPVFHDARNRGVPLSVPFNRSLRPEYQPAARDAARVNVQGVIEMPCGAGKTTTGFAMISSIGVSTLVLVHTGDLLEQWVEGCREILGFEPGIITDGKFRPADITIATVQSLVTLPKHELRTLLSRFGFLLVDEAHHAPASTWQQVLIEASARWRIGLTATPDREDGLEPLMYHSLGPNLFSVTQKQLIEWGYLQPAEVHIVYTTFAFTGKAAKAAAARYQVERELMLKGIPPPALTPEDMRKIASMAAGDYRDAVQLLVVDEERNTAIVDRVVAEAQAGETILVLSGEKKHCQILAEMVNARGIRAEVLTSSTSKKKRKAFLDEMRAGTLQVAMATQLADEGLDVPRLSRVHIAYPGKAQGRLIQRLGRIMRKHDSKQKAVLTDYADKHCSQLWKQFLQRRKVYKELTGKNVK